MRLLGSFAHQSAHQKGTSMFTQTSTPPTATSDAAARPQLPRYAVIAAWAVPIMVIGQFSMVALVPVYLLVIAGAFDRRARILRWWTIALGIAYSIPLAIMNLRPDPAESLSKDMHPALLVLIVAVSVALLFRIHMRRTDRSSTK